MMNNEQRDIPKAKTYIDLPDKNNAYSTEYARYALAEILSMGVDVIIDKELVSKISNMPELEKIDLSEKYKNVEMAECVIFYTIDGLSERQIDLLQKVSSLGKEFFVREFLQDKKL